MVDQFVKRLSSQEIASMAEEHAHSLWSLVDGEVDDELGEVLVPVAEFLSGFGSSADGGLQVYMRCECGVMNRVVIPERFKVVRVTHSCRCGLSFEQDIPQD